MAKISIIIPTYNSAQYICEAIESVLNQTYKDFEIIVVDDGSTDNTKEVIKPYLNKIKYIYQQNSGPSAARNRGIKEAKGEYIAFLDADDIWLPQKLELQIKFMEKEKEVGLIFSDMILFNEKGIIKNSFLKEKLFFNKLSIKPLSSTEKVIYDNVFNALLQENFIPTNTVIVKKECFNKVGFFDETLFSVEDRDMWLRIGLFYDIGFINFPLVLTRFHETNISANQELALKSRLKVMKKFLNYSNLPIKSKKIIKQGRSDIPHVQKPGGTWSESNTNITHKTTLLPFLLHLFIKYTHESRGYEHLALPQALHTRDVPKKPL